MPTKILEAAEMFASGEPWETVTEGFTEEEREAVQTVLEAEGWD